MIIEPSLLDVVHSGSHYTLVQDSQPLVSESGSPLVHHDIRLINYMVRCMVRMPGRDLDECTAYRLFSSEMDISRSSEERREQNVSEILKDDPFIRYWAGADRGSDFTVTDSSLFLDHPEMLTLMLNNAASVGTKLRQYIDDHDLMKETATEEPLTLLFHELGRHLAEGILAYQSAADYLHSRYHCGFLLPAMLAEGYLTSGEFSVAILRDYLTQPNDQGRQTLNKDREKITDLNAILTEIEKTAWEVTEYCSIQRNTNEMEDKLKNLISKGEGNDLEFKSTLRWNLRDARKDPAIEHACLKTLCAFLNTTGGTLLIGVSDDGNIPGIENDGFENTDKFLMHLWNLIKNQIGETFSPYLFSSVENIEGRTVCIVRCQPAASPVFLRQKGAEDEFFIRTGPSTTRLGIGDAYPYIRERFPRA